MMRTGKHFKDVRTADRSTPTSIPRFITYKPQVTVRTTPTTSPISTNIAITASKASRFINHPPARH